MYDYVRTVHLYAGVAILVFLLMYFTTGYLMIHPELVADAEPERTTHTERLRYAGERTPEAYAEYLQDTYGLHGQAQDPVRLENGSWRFRYARPGTAYEAVVSARGDSVRLTESRDSLRRTLIGLHRLHGYGGGFVYDVWSLFYDLASLALIVFAVTGVWMWHRLTRRRFLGWLVLGGSFAYAGATIAYLIYAP